MDSAEFRRWAGGRPECLLVFRRMFRRFTRFTDQTEHTQFLCKLDRALKPKRTLQGLLRRAHTALPPGTYGCLALRVGRDFRELLHRGHVPLDRVVHEAASVAAKRLDLRLPLYLTSDLPTTCVPNCTSMASLKQLLMQRYLNNI